MESFEQTMDSVLTKHEAMQRIEAVRGIIASMGNNDVEFDQLNEIKDMLDAGVYTPEQAVLKAEAIPEGKLSR